jgi:hypothetical protein
MMFVKIGYLKLKKSNAAVTACVFMAIFFASPVVFADMPSNDLLNDLQNRLLKQPDCFPQCVSSPRLLIELNDNVMTMRMEVHSQTDSAVPLPGDVKRWLPQTATLDASPASGLLRSKDGYLTIQVPQGIHEIIMTGTLPPVDAIQIAFPLIPHKTTVKGDGWSVEGLDENGVPDDNIQLKRLKKEEKTTKTAGTDPTNFPQFVQVERTLHLGLTWQVETRIRRLTPTGAAIVLMIPLLDGESVTTEHIRVKDKEALVNMGAQDVETSWISVFDIREKITLKASDTTSFIEIWRLDINPIWHVELEGIPVIHHQDPTGYWLPEWRPWPDETVTLTLSRPEGVPGQTLTIDSSFLAVSPGKRATDSKLNLSLRSSQGGQHRIKLPESAILQSVTINGATQPIRLENRTVTLPVSPGVQTFEILWREKNGIAGFFKTPEVDLGTPSVNGEIEISMPSDRWILFTGGPQIGPAVLFWGVLIIIVIVSLALGRVKLTPLKAGHWFLLCVGLSQTPMEFSVFPVLWLLALGWRKKLDLSVSKFRFNMIQLGLVLLTAIAGGSLLYAIYQGLLGHPDMQISGNGSTNYALGWYQDRISQQLPQAWVFSAPLKVYQGSMLFWALWLAWALLNWLRWGWNCFSENGVWRPFEWFKSRKKRES